MISNRKPIKNMVWGSPWRSSGQDLVLALPGVWVQPLVRELRIFFFFFGYTACGLLGLQPGIEPMAPAVEVWNLSQWTTGEDPE